MQHAVLFSEPPAGLGLCKAATEIHPDVAIVMRLVRWPAAFFAGLVHR